MDLSKRERQIMDILYALGEASARQVHAELPAARSYTSLRTQLRTMEEKGLVLHRQDGVRHIYWPAVPKRKAEVSSLRQMLRTFFGGSTTRAVAALVDLKGSGLSDTELAELEQIVARARAKGR
ncbi:MAG: BlaI/MecI/CopY family transcriptional regulator [Candidatus Latescibacterota bacterium]|jgi:predicted transcriptional regulator